MKLLAPAIALLMPVAAASGQEPSTPENCENIARSIAAAAEGIRGLRDSLLGVDFVFAKGKFSGNEQAAMGVMETATADLVSQMNAWIVASEDVEYTLRLCARR